MTNTQHTPGPWHVEVDGYGYLSICAGGLICDLPENSFANARLIAACPEMLDALQALLGVEPPLLSAKEKKAYAIARAAIAKATGQAD